MSLPRLLFLSLLWLPVLEIYLLIQVGGVIGAVPTIALVVFTAMLGALLLRHQGLVVLLQRVQQLAQQGEVPTAAMLEGVVILVAGVLLLLPGFFTDVLGLLGLVPPLRHVLVAAILRRGLSPRPPPSAPAARPRRSPATLEGQYTREDD